MCYCIRISRARRCASEYKRSRCIHVLRMAARTCVDPPSLNRNEPLIAKQGTTTRPKGQAPPVQRAPSMPSFFASDARRVSSPSPRLPPAFDLQPALASQLSPPPIALARATLAPVRPSHTHYREQPCSAPRNYGGTDSCQLPSRTLGNGNCRFLSSLRCLWPADYTFIDRFRKRLTQRVQSVWRPPVDSHSSPTARAKACQPVAAPWRQARHRRRISRKVRFHFLSVLYVVLMQLHHCVLFWSLCLSTAPSQPSS